MGIWPWRLALVCTLGFVFIYLGAVVLEPGQRLDDQVFGAAQKLGAGPLVSVLPWVARRLVPLVLLVSLALIVLAPGRWPRKPVRSAVFLIILSVGISRVLRDLVLWRPVHGDGYAYPFNTFPSTHTTLVVALAVGVWLLLPHRPRWLAPVLAGVVVMAMVGNVVGLAHRPSDTLGSVLLVGAVTGIVCGFSRRSSADSG